jgi:hypothetical protein
MTRKYIRMGLKIKKKLNREVVELQKMYVFKKIYTGWSRYNLPEEIQ